MKFLYVILVIFYIIIYVKGVQIALTRADCLLCCDSGTRRSIEKCIFKCSYLFRGGVLVFYEAPKCHAMCDKNTAFGFVPCCKRMCDDRFRQAATTTTAGR